MTTIRQKLMVGGIIIGCLLVQFALITASSMAATESRIQANEPAVERSESLSWLEAQQRKHGHIQTVSLSDTQANKLVATMRIMTLDL
ncbi:MAG: hypothetical protein OXT49_09265 [Gammaproteobacteria bacterium]|nr:hypothetical protein [Gammaproteobacteria bacterium]